MGREISSDLEPYARKPLRRRVVLAGGVVGAAMLSHPEAANVQSKPSATPTFSPAEVKEIARIKATAQARPAQQAAVTVSARETATAYAEKLPSNQSVNIKKPDTFWNKVGDFLEAAGKITVNVIPPAALLWVTRRSLISWRKAGAEKAAKERTRNQLGHLATSASSDKVGEGVKKWGIPGELPVPKRR